MCYLSTVWVSFFRCCIHITQPDCVKRGSGGPIHASHEEMRQSQRLSSRSGGGLGAYLRCRTNRPYHPDAVRASQRFECFPAPRATRTALVEATPVTSGKDTSGRNTHVQPAGQGYLKGGPQKPMLIVWRSLLRPLVCSTSCSTQCWKTTIVPRLRGTEYDFGGTTIVRLPPL